MDSNSVNWSGPMPAIVTPFDDHGAIDEQRSPTISTA